MSENNDIWNIGIRNMAFTLLTSNNMEKAFLLKIAHYTKCHLAECRYPESHGSTTCPPQVMTSRKRVVN